MHGNIYVLTHSPKFLPQHTQETRLSLTSNLGLLL